MASATGVQNRSLRFLVLRGSLLESAGFAVGNGLRLLGNLVLTRILFPEAFGLMALVGIFLTAIHLLSDLGLNASVVQNEKGDDPRFLNTVWTLQSMRGAILSLACVAGASPLASFYAEPLLAQVLPFVGISALLAGFNSTSLLTARRHLRIGTLVAIQIGGAVVSISTMLTWAFVSPSVWALAVGGVARALFVLVASHRTTTGIRNRFAWDRVSASLIFHFGKWIFLSTAILFVSQQLDRVILGRLVGLDALGVYSVAVLLAGTIGDLAIRLTHGVVFPALSQVQKFREGQLRRAYYKVRLRLDAALLPFLGGLSVLGSDLVSLLYDQRYVQAGWMLQVFTIRVAMSCTLSQCEAGLVALGHPRYASLRNLVRAVWVVTAIPIGWEVWGITGVVWAVSLSELPAVAVLWVGARRHGILRFSRELLSLALFLCGTALASLVRLVI